MVALQVKCPLYLELRVTEPPLRRRFIRVQIFGGGVLLACGTAFIM